MELRQANKEGIGIKKHGRGGSMACPVLFRRYLILLKSPGRVWEAHNLAVQMFENHRANAQDFSVFTLCHVFKCGDGIPFLLSSKDKNLRYFSVSSIVKAYISTVLAIAKFPIRHR